MSRPYVINPPVKFQHLPTFKSWPQLEDLRGAKFAIAFSGGGDSTALVHMLKDRAPLILIVNHALRASSAREAQEAKSFAQNLGLEARILTWQNDNPKTGIQEKARKARYALMGQACRAAGISYLLTAHTQNDQGETLLMRYDNGTDWRGAAGIAPTAYAPVWPALAGITLIRPLLSQSREALRRYNNQHNLSWSEDPSNRDHNFARIRARARLKPRPRLARALLRAAAQLRAGISEERALFRDIVKRDVKIDQAGLVHLARPVPTALLAILLKVASGGNGHPPYGSLMRLRQKMEEKSFSGMTLCGAFIMAAPNSTFIIGPEPARYKGRHNRAAISRETIKSGQSLIWDGRFMIKSPKDAPDLGISDVDFIVMTSTDKNLRLLSALDRSQLAPLLAEVATPFRAAMPLLIPAAYQGPNQERGGYSGLGRSHITPLAPARLQGLLT